MVERSVLQPVDASTIATQENEEAAPWIIRKLVGSMPGRVVMASLGTLRAAGTSIVCLSPWGDSSPLVLPCIRFRDLVVHSVIVATGGTAAFVTPAMAPIADAVASSSLASSIIVEVTGTIGHEAVVKSADWLFVEKPIELLFPNHATRAQTRNVKVLTITLKYKHLLDSAALGFFRSPVHGDPSLVSDVASYFAVEKGWFSPYLFASNRRPDVPRTMKADVIFAHGPFLKGDYLIAETLLKESEIQLHFCKPPPPREVQPDETPLAEAINVAKGTINSVLKPEAKKDAGSAALDQVNAHPTLIESSIKRLSGMFSHDSKSSQPLDDEKAADGDASLPEGAVDTTDINPLSTAPPPPRRMVILVLGIKPHRAGIWTSSARPSESVIQYLLLDGCPAIVVPIKPGSPLLAWDTLTLQQLQQYAKDGRRSDGVVRIIFEFASLCVDWDRVALPKPQSEEDTDENTDETTPGAEAKTQENPLHSGAAEELKKKAVKDAIALLVEGAMKSKDSKEVKDKVDAERAGIAMFRLP